MNSDEESPVTRFITHDETPWTTLSRRSRGSDDVYHRQVPSSATVSVASSPNEVFSSREPSIATRPTSYGASYPAHGYNKEGRGNTVYAASLSATHGSESEPEAELSDALDAALLGTGAWSASHQAQGQLLRRHEHAKVRLSKSLPHRVKKLPVVLHQNNAGVVSAHDGTEPRTDITSMSNRQGPKCLFYLIPRQHYIMLGLTSLMILTILLSAKHLHSMDRADTASRKRTVFGATTLVTLQVVVTALSARRTLLEASLLGLFPLGIGSMVLLQLNDLA